MRVNGLGVVSAPALTGLRVVVGVAALLAIAAVLALALGALLRRTWAAVLVTLSAVVLPHLLAVLPDGTARWLLRLTPAAGFAVTQTIQEYPQVVAHYAPSAGYYPLAWWAGAAVLCGYATVVLALAGSRLRRGGPASQPRPRRRQRPAAGGAAASRRPPPCRGPADAPQAHNHALHAHNQGPSHRTGEEGRDV
ncbi:hypothetical protein [Streptosporangium sp. DT93]|uniref:hypothetical protein n=1 Tax=Streptosporangium sp. DT93 TaxID=3393428 RepID=UPI003CE8869B